jgi:hypothetical protein
VARPGLGLESKPPVSRAHPQRWALTLHCGTHLTLPPELHPASFTPSGADWPMQTLRLAAPEWGHSLQRQPTSLFHPFWAPLLLTCQWWAFGPLKPGLTPVRRNWSLSAPGCLVPMNNTFRRKTIVPLKGELKSRRLPFQASKPTCCHEWS